jgi:hypothetical protein
MVIEIRREQDGKVETVSIVVQDDQVVGLYPPGRGVAGQQPAAGADHRAGAGHGGARTSEEGWGLRMRKVALVVLAVLTLVNIASAALDCPGTVRCPMHKSAIATPEGTVEVIEGHSYWTYSHYQAGYENNKHYLTVHCNCGADE